MNLGSSARPQKQADKVDIVQAINNDSLLQISFLLNKSDKNDGDVGFPYPKATRSVTTCSLCEQGGCRLSRRVYSLTAIARHVRPILGRRR